MKIKNNIITDESKCFLIAEIGSNHNKDKQVAKKLIDIAAESGVDAVKFQTLKPNDIAKEDILADEYGKFEYTEKKNYWYEVLNDLVLPFEWHQELFDYARSKDLIVLSTPESVEAVELLENLGVPAYKVASMDITNKPLLEKIARTKKPVIISSGIAEYEDLDKAIVVLKQNGTTEISILHCISNYPPKTNEMSLNMIKKYKSRYSDCVIGLSNHSDNNFFDGVSVALGARIIEKHITLNKEAKGPDHHFALNPRMLKDFVNTVRKTEKALKINPDLSQKKKNKKELYARSIIIVDELNKEDIITRNKIDFKRPGTGISPMELDNIIGKKVNKYLSKNTVLNWDNIYDNSV